MTDLTPPDTPSTTRPQKLRKLIASIGLAMALFFFLSLGGNAPEGSPFRGPVLSWVWVLVGGAVVIAVALALAAVLTPQRPGPVAATVGGLGGLFMFVLPNVWISLSSLADGSLDRPLRELYVVFAWCWADALPLAVACWAGASCWHSDSWSRYWQGAGGAVVRGGVVAGVVCLPVLVGLRFYVGVVGSGILGVEDSGLRWFPWLVVTAQSLASIPRGAVVTALLASSRPSRWLGALMGAVLLGALALVLLYVTISDRVSFFFGEFRPLLLPTVLLEIVPAIVIGGIAGSYAGQWVRAIDGAGVRDGAAGA